MFFFLWQIGHVLCWLCAHHCLLVSVSKQTPAWSSGFCAVWLQHAVLRCPVCVTEACGTDDLTRFHTECSTGNMSIPASPEPVSEKLWPFTLVHIKLVLASRLCVYWALRINDRIQTFTKYATYFTHKRSIIHAIRPLFHSRVNSLVM